MAKRDRFDRADALFRPTGRAQGSAKRLGEVRLDRLAGAGRVADVCAADTPYKTIDDVRNAKEPPRCGAQGTSDSAYYVPKLFEELIGTKFNLVQGYPGGEIDLGVERGEIHCRAFTIEAFFSREPYYTWRKKGFVRNIIQTGKNATASCRKPRQFGSL